MITILKIFIGITGLFIFISINPIYSVLSLITTFIAVGSLFIYLDITFIGLSYFIIYVGAISILFIFTIMILQTDLFINPSFKEKLGLKKEIPLISGIGIIFLLGNGENKNILINHHIIDCILDTNFIKLSLSTSLFDYINGKKLANITEIYRTNQFIWENNLFYLSQIKFIGYNLYTYYSLWLILISFILLLAMIAPIILCLKYIEQEKK